MTHDPTRDCEHGRLKGKCAVCDVLAEVMVQSLQCAHCHVTIETLNDKAVYLIAEVERLNRVNVELVEVLKELSLYVAYNGDTWVQDKSRTALAKATGETK